MDPLIIALAIIAGELLFAINALVNIKRTNEKRNDLLKDITNAILNIEVNKENNIQLIPYPVEPNGPAAPIIWDTGDPYCDTDLTNASTNAKNYVDLSTEPVQTQFNEVRGDDWKVDSTLK